MFLKAEPQKTGTSAVAKVAFRKARRMSSGAISSPSKYLTNSSSSNSATASRSSSRALAASSTSSAGISVSRLWVPKSSTYLMVRIRTRSTIPVKSSSLPTGS